MWHVQTHEMNISLISERNKYIRMWHVHMRCEMSENIREISKKDAHRPVM